jgi:hypothetical protein
MAALAYPTRTVSPNRTRRATSQHARLTTLTNELAATSVHRGAAPQVAMHRGATQRISLQRSATHVTATGRALERPRSDREAEAGLEAPLAPVVAFPTTRAARRRFARRRLAVTVAATAFFAAVWFGSGLLVDSGSSHLDVLSGSVRTAQGYRYVVQPGDTVWSIASRLQPTGDVEPLVDRLDASFGGSVLHVGQTVLVP